MFTVWMEEDCVYWNVLQYPANGTKNQEMFIRSIILKIQTILVVKWSKICLCSVLQITGNPTETTWLCAIMYSHLKNQSQYGKVEEFDRNVN